MLDGELATGPQCLDWAARVVKSVVLGQRDDPEAKQVPPQ
jgi:hypothetical protein